MSDDKGVVVAEVCWVSPVEYVRVREALTRSQARVKELEERATRLEEALKELLSMPWDIDPVTIPPGGLDVAPQQVVGTMSVSLDRMRKFRKALTRTE